MSTSTNIAGLPTFLSTHQTPMSKRVLPHTLNVAMLVQMMEAATSSRSRERQLRAHFMIVLQTMYTRYLEMLIRIADLESLRASVTVDGFLEIGSSVKKYYSNSLDLSFLSS